MSVHPEAMAPPKEQSMPAYPGEGEFNPIAFTDEYTYCCGGPGCYVMPDFLCGYLGCPLCCFALPDHTMQAAVDAANYQYGLLGLDRAVLMYKFERADINGKKGFRATEVFRNAEAVDVYHKKIMGDPCLMCQSLTLLCRQNFGEMKVYGDLEECKKVTYDAGRVEGDLKKDAVEKWNASTVEDITAKFGPLHYGWTYKDSANVHQIPDYQYGTGSQYPVPASR